MPMLEEKIKRVIRDVPGFPKPGILFKDITPLFYHQSLCTEIVDTLVTSLKVKPDAVMGIESRGFLFGFAVANRLGIPFVLVRKKGKLPAVTVQVEYELEYGTSVMEVHADALKPGWKVMIHDDLLATGGTAEAAARLVKKCGAMVSDFTFVIALDFLNGISKLEQHTKHITCLAHY